MTDNSTRALADNTLPPGTWRLDPMGSKVMVVVKKMRFITVTVALEPELGEVVVDDDGEVSSVDVTLIAASAESGMAKRDTHLRSADFLDVGSHRLISFQSTDVVRSGLDFTAKGTLSIKGKQSPLTLDVTAVSVVGESSVFSFSGAADRNVIGLDKLPSFVIADELRVAGSAKANLAQPAD
ncbi:MAG: polyisoprenoid-binding protein YceI [Acidimicrobiales bacterium]